MRALSGVMLPVQCDYVAWVDCVGSMLIADLTVSGMWSFGAQAAKLIGFGQHNVLIGKNNVGKSKVLAAIRWIGQHHAPILGAQPIGIEDHILHDAGKAARPPSFLRVVFSQDGYSTAKCREALDKEDAKHNRSRSPINEQMLADVLTLPIAVEAVSTKDLHLVTKIQTVNSDVVKWDKYRAGSQPASELEKTWQYTCDVVAKASIAQLHSRIKYLNGWRTLKDNVDGETIVKRLHQWQAPSRAEKHKRDTFDAVQRLFRELMRDPTVDLIPQHDAGSLQVATAGRYLPITDLGDGVQHLLMIAFHLATRPECVLLMEEPETHLHPELQRNMMRILYRESHGQSITTTHAPALLDASLKAKVFRIEWDKGSTRATACDTTDEVRVVLDHLDVRSSDILQANLVIWVEGPTDRMFIKHCLALAGESFTEGVDYQFAYYGGSVRSHVTLDDGASDLVNLLRLCRNAVMVCDSDRGFAEEPLDASKERIKKECERIGAMCWVTEGREIENYFPDEVLTAAYRDLLGDKVASISLGQFDNLHETLAAQFPEPQHGKKWRVKYDDNKVAVFPTILKHVRTDSMNRWGLRDRISELVERIKRANPA
jgi:hypothetical protein